MDPCEDFYNFACGGWINKHPIPQSQSFWDQLSLLREELLQDLRLLLEEPDVETDLEPVKMARTLYRTCMDVGKFREVSNVYLNTDFVNFNADKIRNTAYYRGSIQNFLQTKEKFMETLNNK